MWWGVTWVARLCRTVVPLELLLLMELQVRMGFLPLVLAAVGQYQQELVEQQLELLEQQQLQE